MLFLRITWPHLKKRYGTGTMITERVPSRTSDHLTPKFSYSGRDANTMPPDDRQRRRFTLARADADQMP